MSKYTDCTCFVPEGVPNPDCPIKEHQTAEGLIGLGEKLPEIKCAEKEICFKLTSKVDERGTARVSVADLEAFIRAVLENLGHNPDDIKVTFDFKREKD